jgi:hypothetical protein
MIETQVFAERRRLLLHIACRMMESVADAEDLGAGHLAALP